MSTRPLRSGTCAEQPLQTINNLLNGSEAPQLNVRGIYKNWGYPKVRKDYGYGAFVVLSSNSLCNLRNGRFVRKEGRCDRKLHTEIVSAEQSLKS